MWIWVIACFFVSMTDILITTTVPETLASILKDQPAYLAKYFDVKLASSPGNVLDDVSLREGLPAYHVSMERGINPLKDLFSLLRMIIVLFRTKPRLVHSYTPKAGLITMLAAWICRIPFRVHTFTGLIFPTSRGFKRALLICIDRLICACATHVVPEGRGAKRDLVRFCITRKPLCVIGHGNVAGVDTTYFSRLSPGVDLAAGVLRGALGIGTKEFVFCFVGRLNKDKGLAELLQAFATSPQDAHLLLVGAIDQTAPVGAGVLAAIDAHPRVHAVGFLEDVRSAMAAADVLVLPSYREGFPNAVLQAGAMALPVIATDINGCNEVIEPGFNGWLVPPRDAPALQVAMREAIHASGDTRLHMGQRARVRIQQRFEQHEHWERMVQFYQGLLSARQTG